MTPLPLFSNALFCTFKLRTYFASAGGSGPQDLFFPGGWAAEVQLLQICVTLGALGPGKVSGGFGPFVELYSSWCHWFRSLDSNLLPPGPFITTICLCRRLQVQSRQSHSERLQPLAICKSLMASVRGLSKTSQDPHSLLRPPSLGLWGLSSYMKSKKKICRPKGAGTLLHKFLPSYFMCLVPYTYHLSSVYFVCHTKVPFLLQSSWSLNTFLFTNPECPGGQQTLAQATHKRRKSLCWWRLGDWTRRKWQDVESLLVCRPAKKKKEAKDLRLWCNISSILVQHLWLDQQRWNANYQNETTTTPLHGPSNRCFWETQVLQYIGSPRCECGQPTAPSRTWWAHAEWCGMSNCWGCIVLRLSVLNIKIDPLKTTWLPRHAAAIGYSKTLINKSSFEGPIGSSRNSYILLIVYSKSRTYQAPSLCFTSCWGRGRGGALFGILVELVKGIHHFQEAIRVLARWAVHLRLIAPSALLTPRVQAGHLRSYFEALEKVESHPGFHLLKVLSRCRRTHP